MVGFDHPASIQLKMHERAFGDLFAAPNVLKSIRRCQ